MLRLEQKPRHTLTPLVPFWEEEKLVEKIITQQIGPVIRTKKLLFKVLAEELTVTNS